LPAKLCGALSFFAHCGHATTMASVGAAPAAVLDLELEVERELATDPALELALESASLGAKLDCGTSTAPRHEGHATRLPAR
jgi:hypothetical protein